MNESIEDIEIDAMSHLTGALSRPLSLVERAFDLTARALEMERGVSDQSPTSSRLVTTHLLGRVSNDLRCVALLAQRGYAMQAASLAACAFESGLAVAYIGGDDATADDWLKHHDAKKPW